MGANGIFFASGREEENEENDKYEKNSRGHPQALPYLSHVGDRNKGNSFSKISFFLPLRLKGTLWSMSKYNSTYLLLLSVGIVNQCEAGHRFQPPYT